MRQCRQRLDDASTPELDASRVDLVRHCRPVMFLVRKASSVAPCTHGISVPLLVPGPWQAGCHWLLRDARHGIMATPVCSTILSGSWTTAAQDHAWEAVTVAASCVALARVRGVAVARHGRGCETQAQGPKELSRCLTTVKHNMAVDDSRAWSLTSILATDSPSTL